MVMRSSTSLAISFANTLAMLFKHVVFCTLGEDRDRKEEKTFFPINKLLQVLEAVLLLGFGSSARKGLY